MASYHSNSNVSPLEYWPITGPSTCYRDNLTALMQLGGDDAVNQGVLVQGRGVSQHSQPWPHSIHLLLANLAGYMYV